VSAHECGAWSVCTWSAVGERIHPPNYPLQSHYSTSIDALGLGDGSIDCPHPGHDPQSPRSAGLSHRSDSVGPFVGNITSISHHGTVQRVDGTQSKVEHVRRHARSLAQCIQTALETVRVGRGVLGPGPCAHDQLWETGSPLKLSSAESSFQKYRHTRPRRWLRRLPTHWARSAEAKKRRFEPQKRLGGAFCGQYHLNIAPRHRPASRWRSVQGRTRAETRP
jgi:hypothetical protein